MQDREFRKWLIQNKTLKPRSRKDQLSHCRRVEKLFNANLDDIIESVCFEEVKKNIIDFSNLNKEKKYLKSQLTHSIDLYRKFLLDKHKA